MSRDDNRRTGRARAALIGIPVAGALMLGLGGYAWANTGSEHTTTVTANRDAGSSYVGHGKDDHDGKDQNRQDYNKSDSNKSDHGKLPYTSSVQAPPRTPSQTKAEWKFAVAQLAKISISDAATAAQKAVPGSVVVSVELKNIGGNVVYKVEVITSTAKTKLVIDAGNGAVLATRPDH